MTVSPVVPKIDISVTAGTARLPSEVTRAAVYAACSTSGTAYDATVRSSGAAAQSTFGDGKLSQMMWTHGALDPKRTPIMLVKLPSTNAGALHLDVSGVNGTSVVTADGTLKPNNRYAPRFEVTVGGTIGVAGIKILRSADDGRHTEEVELGTANVLEIPTTGIKLNFAAGDLDAGDVVVGWTEGPKCDANDYDALFEALKNTTSMFSMLILGEPVVPAEVAKLQSGLTLLEQYARDVHCVFPARPRYHATLPLAVTVTFANANPDTITRASGSWITDGVKIGMRVTTSGTVSNNGTFVRVAAVSSTVVTMTPNVVFVAEATIATDLLFEETEDDYAANIASEWSGINDPRLTRCDAEVRVDVPTPRLWRLDKPWSEELASKLIVGPIDIEPGQVAQAGVVGGALAVRLNAAIYEAAQRIHYDADEDPALPTARGTALRRLPDGRTGAFVNRGLTLAGPTDSVDTIVKARLQNEWKRVVRSALTNEILTGFFADAQDPNRLSEGACQDIESRVIPALRTAFNGKISNLSSPSPNALFLVDRESDLSTGKITVTGKIITKFYAAGFDVSLTVTQPGQVN